MRVCIHVPTGRLLEAQSGGEGNEALAVLLQNAAVAFPDLPSGELEARYVSEVEYQSLLYAAQHPAPTLDQLKTAKRAAINAAREARSAAGVAYNAKLFDSDSVSIQKINGAVTMALIANANAQPFAITWTAADDTEVALDAAGMIGLGLAVGNHVDVQHQWARTKKTELAAAQTPEAVAAVDLSA